MTSTTYGYVATRNGEILEEFYDPEDAPSVIKRMGARYPGEVVSITSRATFLNNRWERPDGWDAPSIQSLIHLLADCRGAVGCRLTDAQKGKIRECILTLHDAKEFVPAPVTNLPTTSTRDPVAVENPLHH